MEIKGIWILLWVKTIKKVLEADPGKKAEFDCYLTEADWHIIAGWINPLQFYPYESFQRIGRAVFYVVAQKDLNKAQLFGHAVMIQLLQHHKSWLIVGDPIASLQKFCTFHDEHFKGVKSKAVLSSFTEIEAVILLELAESDRNFQDGATAFAYQLAGSCMELAKQAGAKNLHLTIKEQRGDFVYNLQWQ